MAFKIITCVALGITLTILIAAGPTCLRAAPPARSPALQPAPSPTANEVFTSTRQVTALRFTDDGTLWVGTAGGVLRRAKDGMWQKFTRFSGLPSHEVRGFETSVAGEVKVLTPRGAALWRSGHWRQWNLVPLLAKEGSGEVLSQGRNQPPPTPPLQEPVLSLPKEGEITQTAQATWRDTTVVATLTGLRIGAGKTARLVSLPKSKGTHVSALLPHGEKLWAALFGDGLWSFDGKTWQPLNIGLPEPAREITALAGDDKTLWIGTRREGVWQYNGNKWTQHLQPDEPYDHNVQNLMMYGGVLFMSTLEDGLMARTGDGWKRFSELGTRKTERGNSGLSTQHSALSSNAPRQMVEFRGALYVRHGGQKIDRFDGGEWTRDVCSSLPRKKVMAMAADGQKLYVVQWGGWSEFDGKTWTHYLALPELQGLPIVSLYPEGNTLWLGTVNRGLVEFDHATGKLRWHDERAGLPDDWITSIARVGKTLYAGTFVGGLAWWDGAQWKIAPQLKGENVTALEPDGSGGVFIGTRTGLWHRAADGALEKVETEFLDPEVQSLCAVQGGLWVGTRTGLFFVCNRPDSR
ncbi:MAG: hypothetical protein M3347_19010 [Armatimonadota bacterium]|nr:hypothetical protein [Armatimonadota bacterium]